MREQHTEERQQDNYIQQTDSTPSRSGRTSDKLTYLLFAPKSGSELRTDIADAARKGADKTRETASQLGEKSSGYLNTAKQKAGDFYSRTGGALNAARSEFGKKSGAENERNLTELSSGDHDALGSAALNRDEHDDFPVA